MPPQSATRRAFLKTGTAASLALFAPTIIPATALGRDGHVTGERKLECAREAVSVDCRDCRFRTVPELNNEIEVGLEHVAPLLGTCRRALR